MAESNADLPEYDSGSLLKSAAIGSPFVAGVGIASYRAMQEGGVQPVPASIKEAAKVLGDIKQKVSRPSYNAHLDFMNLAHTKGFFKNQSSIRTARTAWAQALASTAEYSGKYLPTGARNIANLPDDQVIDAINNMARNQSDITSSLFNKFRSNFFALNGVQNIPSFTEVKGLAFDIPASIRNTPPPANISTKLNALGAWSSEFFSRRGFMEEGLGVHRINLGVAGRSLEFNLPMSAHGAVVEGLTQSTRRISPDIGIVDPMTKGIRLMKREEFFLTEVEKSIIPDIKTGRFETQGDINRAVSSLYKRVYGELETIPNIPGNLQDPAFAEYQLVRGQALDLVTEAKRKADGRDLSTAFRSLTIDEASEAMRTHGLYAGTGPQGLAKGRVQRTNLTEGFLIPEAYDWSRRPEQAVRPYGLAPGSDIPRFKALYVDPEKYAEMLTMGEGQLIAAESVADRIKFQEQKTLHLKAVAGENIEEFIKSVEAGSIKPGDVLGRDLAGDIVKAQEGSRYMTAITNKTKSRGEFLTLVEVNAKRMQTNEKVFGDAKGLMRLTEDMWFNNKVRKITNQNLHLENVNVIVSMDELKKDPGKFSKQIITSMADVIGRRELPGGLSLNTLELAESLKQEALAGGGFNREVFTESAMRRAAAMRFTPEEWASTFGAVPYALGDEKAGQILQRAVAGDASGEFFAPKYIQAMKQGIAGGQLDVVWGGPAELRGAGRMGSIEPRMLETMRAGVFAKFKDPLTADLFARMKAADPRAFASHEALGKTIASIGGLAKPGKTSNIFNIQTEYLTGNIEQEFDRFVEKGGGWMRPGKGLHDIFVPGGDSLASIKPYLTPEGRVVYPDVAEIYRRMAQETSRMYSTSDPVHPSQVTKELGNIVNELHKQQAPAGKGIGAYMRGRVIGSKYLTAVDTVAGFEAKNALTAGLPVGQAEQMFAELGRSGLWNAPDLEEMRARFMNYQPIAGVVGRHPAIGEYSAQPMLFRRVDTDLPQIAMPEFNVRARFKGMEESVGLKIGPLVGMSGDKDADILSTMLVRPDIEKELRKDLLSQDSEYLQRYTQHQVRYQMLKAKSAQEVANLPTIERMIGSAKGLAATPEWVPKLSLQMSQAKRAVESFASGSEAADARMMLEWLEQTPLGGKHLSKQAAASGELSTGLLQLSRAFEGRDATAVSENITNILQGNKVAQSLLKSDITLEQADADSIAKIMNQKRMSTTIKGVDIDKSLNTIMSSLDKFRSTGLENEMNMLTARGKKLGIEQIPELVAMQKASSSFGKGQGFAAVSSAIQSASNRMGALGQGIIKHHKSIGLGFATMLGLGAVLSTPEEIVGKGAALIPQGKIRNPNKAANEVKPEDMGVVSRSVGNPTPPNLLGQQSARISPPYKNFNIRARADSVNSRALAGISKDLSGQNRQVNVRLDDARSTANHHVLMNRLAGQ